MATLPTYAIPDERQPFTPEKLPVDELHLDARNPRIQRVGENLNQEQILKILWEEYSVDEVAMSIAQNGFFPHEPLFVAEEDGKHVVIEGNRRLAAVRLLCDPKLRNRLQAESLPKVSKQFTARIANLPVIHCERETIWQYVGFKHVNGPQAWTSFAKAEYIAWVRNDLHAALEDVARTIGDYHLTVARLYRAYMALKQAEEEGFYDREWRTRKHFSFSHLYTGLDYQGIREFTRIADLEPPSAQPIPKRKLKNFGELCIWLWGDKRQDKPAVIRSQNPDLRRLDEALQSRKGIDALRAGYNIDDAADIAHGDTALFRESLLKAKHSLQDARGKVVTGFAGERDLLKEIGEIMAITEALDDDMRRISNARVSRRRGRQRKA